MIVGRYYKVEPSRRVPRVKNTKALTPWGNDCIGPYDLCYVTKILEDGSVLITPGMKYSGLRIAKSSFLYKVTEQDLEPIPDWLGSSFERQRDNFHEALMELKNGRTE